MLGRMHKIQEESDPSLITSRLGFTTQTKDYIKALMINAQRT